MKEFHTAKEMYAQKKVLMQHGDNVRHVDHGTEGNDQAEGITFIEQRDSRIASSPLHELIRNGFSRLAREDAKSLRRFGR